MTEQQKMKFSDEISIKRMVFYSLGGISTGLLFAMWGQIQYFAATVLLIPTSVIPLIYLIYSIIDGLNDPIIGYLADKSKRFTSKFGKRFPWIVTGLIIGPILLILNFIQISPDLLTTVIWLILIMAIYETFMTSAEINQMALFPDLFREDVHRRKVIVIGAIIGGIASIITQAIIPRFITSLGYIWTVIIVVIISYVFAVPFILAIRESSNMKNFRAELDSSQRGSSPVAEVIKRIFKDRNWMAITIAGFAWSISGACFLYGLNFYVQHSLGLEIGATALPLLMVYAVGFLLAPLWTWISKKIGVKNAYLAGMLCNIASYLVLVFVTDLTSLTLAYVFAGIGFSATSGVIFSLLRAEGIDNATVNSGKREEGSYSGIYKIFTAFSYFFQTIIFAIVAGFTGYNPLLGVSNSNIAKFGLLFQMSIIPMIITIIGTVAFFFMYKVSKEEAKENKVKIEEMNL
ncbi:MAG: MFS transporter [Candidatus Lokiarchaeota archaeon]|nr:MFS transporter [Candidatus Lokiarchaeota archaeon]